ncbi:hypothetical protein [Moraxella canis]|uniref:hypothetical protein n=1 Tax=Moraxella canis TaxID=90239 RepID=UPI001428A351|nr:hypothetical protein [Moraxella canis]
MCTYGDDTSLPAYNVFSTGGDSSHPEYNLCIEFYPTEGFSQYYNPVHIKTGRIASRL